jgi:hypothetical protein
MYSNLRIKLVLIIAVCYFHAQNVKCNNEKQSSQLLNDDVLSDLENDDQFDDRGAIGEDQLIEELDDHLDNFVYSDKNNLKKYRTLSVNSIYVLKYDAEEEEEQDNKESEVHNEFDEEDEEKIDIYLNDEISFVCDLPRKLYQGYLEWKLNNMLLNYHATEYTLLVDTNTNLTELNVSCLFYLSENKQLVSLRFPTLLISKLYYL